MTPLPDKYDHPAFAMCISGMKGTGKTTEFLKRIKNHKSRDGRPAKYKFIFDTEREVSTRLGIPICTTIEQMNARVEKALPVCFDPSQLFNMDTQEGAFDALEFFCRWVWNLSHYLPGVKLLAVDEIQDHTTTFVNGVPDHLKKIINKGRRKQIDFLCIVNRGINNVSEHIRGQLTDLVVFQTTSANALDYLKDSFSKEELAQIRELKIGKFLHAKI